MTLFCYKPSCFSYEDDRVHGLVSMRIPRFEHEKVGGFVTKQGHRQPRFYSKARALSAQLKNGLIAGWFARDMAAILVNTNKCISGWHFSPIGTNSIFV